MHSLTPFLTLSRVRSFSLVCLISLASGCQSSHPDVNGKVVYAKKDIEKGCTIWPGALEETPLPQSKIPATAILSASVASGRQASHAIKSGQMLLTPDLIKEQNLTIIIPVSLAVSPDGKTLATACDSTKIKLWNLKSGAEEGSLSAEKQINGLAFSPDGKLLAGSSNSSDEPIVKVWDVASKKILASFIPIGIVNGIAFSSDAKSIFLGSGNWDAKTGKLIGNFKDEKKDSKTDSVALGANGKVAVSSGSVIKVWDPNTRKGLRDLPIVASIFTPLNAGAISPDGKLVALEVNSSTSDDKATAKTADDKTAPKADDKNKGGISIVDVATGKEVHHIGVLSSRFLAFSRDGKVIAESDTVPDDTAVATITLWDVSSGKKLSTISGQAVVFCPDKKTLVSANWDDDIKVFDAASGKQLRSMKKTTSKAN